MTIGDRIKQLRIAKGWTQKELSDKCGISTNSIYKYENNLSMPRMPQTKAIAAALGITYEGLMSGGESAPVTLDEEGKREALESNAREIYLNGLPKDERDAIDRIVASLKEKYE